MRRGRLEEPKAAVTRWRWSRVCGRLLGGVWTWTALSLLCTLACGGESCGRRERVLYLVHASDMEGEILSHDGAGGVARFSTVARALAAKAPDRTLVVAAGDLFMPGAFLRLRLDDIPAVALALRALPLDVSALGNHEFDSGEAFLAEMVGLLPFPYLSATVTFEAGPMARWNVAIEGDETPWIEEGLRGVLPRAKRCIGRLVDEGGAKRCEGFAVGLVGATTAGLETVASVAPTARSLPDLPAVRDAVQAQVDRLEEEGVDVVVLLSHLQGVHRELELLELGLRGVDVIVAGGGDDRLAQPAHRLLPGDHPSPHCAGERSCYPLLREGADGAPVVVVATDGQYRYVGRLGLRFDARGRVKGIAADSRPWPVDDRTLEELGVEVAEEGRALEARLHAALAPGREIVAHARHRLNGEREDVRNRETNLGVASVDALVWAVEALGVEVDLGLRNGGSIRASLGEAGGGPIRRSDVEASLPFDDAVVVVQTTHRMLKETLEAGLREVGTGRGWFPQLSSGALLVYDAAGPEQVRTADGRGVAREGGRVRELRFVRGGEVVEVVADGVLLDPDATVRLVTLDYLTRGGDGYFPSNVAKFSVVAPRGGQRLGEREALIDFLRSEAWGEGAAYPDPPTKGVLRRGAMQVERQ